VDIGSWEEIPAAKLDDVVAVIDSLVPLTAGLRNLLDDLKKMAVSAKHDGCSNRPLTFQRLKWIIFLIVVVLGIFWAMSNYRG
jgi:hypothetical protein